MPAKIEINHGDKYGMLTIVSESESHRKKNGALARMVNVVCECGVKKKVRLSSIREGSTVSCGCFHKANAKHTIGSFAKTHGKSKTNLYVLWQAMKSRCYNKNNKSYGRYGAKGIKVCDEWLNNFEAFESHMGEKRDGLTIERIDSSKGYEPNNVRWATYTEQARNTKRNVIVSVGGKKMTLVEACELLNVSYEKTRVALKSKQSLGEISNV
jgi:hypothetical protein